MTVLRKTAGEGSVALLQFGWKRTRRWSESLIHVSRTFISTGIGCPRKNRFGETNASQEFVEDSPPTLSDSEIDLHLRKHEVSSKSGSIEEVIESFETCTVAANKPTEDHYSIARCSTTGAWLFGIFDGHGGNSCSKTLAGRLFDYCCMSLLPDERRKELLRNFDLNELEWHYSSIPRDIGIWDAELHRRKVEEFLSDFSEADIGHKKPQKMVRNALQHAFLSLDKNISHEAMPDMKGNVDLVKIRAAVAGSCACVAQVRGPNLHVCNVGDSSAILGVCSDNGAWTARQLVMDHSIDNPSEVKRIRSEHPLREADTILRGGRLLGELFPLRAFGDVRYKWPAELQEIVISPVVQRFTIPKGLHTPPYLKAEPEVFYHMLTPNDRFLVIASDGLWDVLTPDRVVRLVADHMEGKETLSTFTPSLKATIGAIGRDLGDRRKGKAKRPIDSNGATHLIRAAIGGNGEDQYDRLRFSLSLPPGMAREHRDDITVQIVYFNARNIDAHS